MISEFIRKRAEEERNPVIRRLLERDQNFLDRIQVQMATARGFLIIIRLHNEKGTGVFSYLDRIEKSLKEQEFSASRAGSGDCFSPYPFRAFCGMMLMGLKGW